ncbi:MAG TPA: hypothetical protein DC061_01565 [Gemmobacter sp.]|nr:hypothetical protein [Gemmobacter sp.]
MTLAVMMRASLGHTSRELQAVRLTLAFVSVALAARLCRQSRGLAGRRPVELPNPARRRPDGERRHQRCFVTEQRAAAVEPDGDVGAGPGRVRRSSRDTARADFRYARWCRPDGRAWRARRRHCRPPRSRR